MKQEKIISEVKKGAFDYYNEMTEDKDKKIVKKDINRYFSVTDVREAPNLVRVEVRCRKLIKIIFIGIYDVKADAIHMNVFELKDYRKLYSGSEK